jgi:hypothetical protein
MIMVFKLPLYNCEFFIFWFLKRRKSISFKKELNQIAEKLNSEEINEVKILNDSVAVNHYRLMNLATVNSDGSILDLKKQAWLPFYIENLINIFSYDVYEEIEDSRGNRTGNFEKVDSYENLNFLIKIKLSFEGKFGQIDPVSL